MRAFAGMARASSGALALVATLAVASPPVVPWKPGDLRIRIGRSAAAAAVRSAVLGARSRLDDVKCRAIVGDFNDTSGKSLEENLQLLAGSLAEYLSLIGFYDGVADLRCRKRDVLAVTAPGSRTVLVCPAFLETQKRDAGWAEIVILHEALHSLGLGENPPSSAWISRRVADRCGESGTLVARRSSQ